MNDHNVETMREEALDALKGARDAAALELWRREWLGRRGKVSVLLRSLKDLTGDQRRPLGTAANDLRGELEKLYRDRAGSPAESVRQRPFDVTAPGRRVAQGHYHPLTIVRYELEDYFRGLGFSVIEGPEIETEWYNFEALNIPAEHPARDMWDTLWLRDGDEAGGDRERDGRLLLRTHTSPVQVRYMERNQPPFRIIVPGRTYRREATDATHSHTFDQLEGLMVGKDVTLANLRAIVQGLFERVLGPEAAIRFRPSYFPFTEPSVEVEVRWGDRWLEMMGAGMVHQSVFKAAGYVPGEWQGFAFGMGLDRLAMVKYSIGDIRLLYENDLRFLEQF